MSTAAAIETFELTRTFREPRRLLGRTAGPPITALDRLTLRVEPGECVALVGPNGAGKSTLLRVLATSIAPTSGDAIVTGSSVVKAPGSVRRSIGVMIGDDRSFFWRLTGLENLLFFGRLQGVDPAVCRSRADSLLERLGLGPARDQRFAGYSTGMRQRLGLARAVLHEPRVLLLDEPTASLDLDHRAQVLDLVRDSLLPEGAALIASHDAGLAASLAGRVIRLEHGAVVSSPAAGRSLTYHVRVRGLSPASARSLGEPASSDADTFDLTIHDLGDGHALTAALAGVVAAGGEIIDVQAASRQAAELRA